MRPTVVTPDVVTATFTYRNGRTEPVYLAPYPREGPVRLADAEGRAVLAFMYAHFVFQWLEGTQVVRISHGTLAGPRILLWREVPIEGRWSPEVLAGFGRRWAEDQLAR
ncbi:hypothetical protein [Amycolatopsis cihanbeyliensis]|uniref:Uncharacterized protein n=1 Tax=Amycolatopsis cihanbeyliensis TaxID=1128664 RepID=A0A542CST5_AMYCI|nr:hypothetical protein [Amycolatopsis cihanbeyliensis]TQI93891.1 hypothetical protein FB471_6037 [Amycolatopsis cihanbeyliensis]